MIPDQSILQRERAKGYSDGWAQASMLSSDDAYEKGRLNGRAERNGEHKQWWCFGVLCGVGLSAIAGAFL